MSNKELVKSALHFIENWIDYQVFIKEIPGVAIGIYFEDEVIFKKEYGYANLQTKEKLTENHLFRIASHSKLFTATAIMKLYHQDKLSVDDRISKHLPWFKSENDDNLNNIRISHVLTHASGITRDGVTGHWIKMKFPNIDAIKEQVPEGISFFGPSETLKYSNFGYTLLGQVVEAVSGKNYQEYIQQEILDPLGMKNTYVDIDDSNHDLHATGHKRKMPKQDRDVFPHVAAKVMDSATGFSSTVGDMLKFYQSHFFGNDILLPDYIKRDMQRTQFESKSHTRGFGFGQVSVGSIKLVGHGGGYPGFITRSGLNQDKKLIIISLTNAVDGPAFVLLSGVARIVDYIIKNKDKLQLDNKDEIIKFEDFIGFYATDWGVSLYSNIGDKLVSTNPLVDNPIETLELFEHKENSTFITPTNLPYGSPGQPLKFVRGDDGKYVIDSEGNIINSFEYSY